MAPKNRRPRREVEKFVELLENEMPPEAEWMIGGSWRRKAPTVGDLDVMVVTESGLFTDFQFPPSFTPTRHGPQIVNGILTLLKTPYWESDVIGCDFWACKPEQVGAFQMFITGPAQLNIIQRAHAQKLGFVLGSDLRDKSGKVISRNPERAMYEYLGLEWIEPEDRQRWAEEIPSTATETQSWQVPSSSGSSSYKVTRKTTPKSAYWECECLGFVYNREIPRICKHIKNVKQKFGLSLQKGGRAQ